MRNTISTTARWATAAYRKLMISLPNPPYQDQHFLLECIASRGIPYALEFKDNLFKRQVTSFLQSMKLEGYQYRFSPSVQEPTLYSSVYACMTQSLMGEIDKLSDVERRAWADYFDSFQSPEDGLFRDEAVLNDIYEDADWWGARHLILQIITAYTALGHLPKYPFRFLDRYKEIDAVRKWLDRQNWKGVFHHSNDIDNKIMNIACALQYEGDFRNDSTAREIVSFIQKYLLERRNRERGLWGQFSSDDAVSLSRAIQFAYHLYAMYFYDGLEPDDAERIIDLTLKTQNQLGGYGLLQNSSACEDIDSIDLMCRLALITSFRNEDVKLSIRRALVWLFSNQNDDGGFVFRRNQALTYGHPLMSSKKNESSMFATWFRVLSIAYAMRFLCVTNYHFVRCPGYQF